MAGTGSARRVNADKGGFTLIEVLIASVILVVALAGFLSVAATTTNLGGRNVRLATANSLVYDKYESLKLADLANVCPVSPCVESNIGVDSTGATVAGIYTRTVTVTAIDLVTPLSMAKNVQITVAWTGHSVSQTSIFMRAQ
jgi:prepilin-type N-terminal cleavage/methylation domain-containing protein